MSMRISKFALAPVLLLAACAPESGAPEGIAIQCAVGEDAGWDQTCILEPSAPGEFTIHNPDDSFQRFRYEAARITITPIDGADEVSNVRINMSDNDGLIEFTFRNMRYRFDPTPVASSGNE